MFSGDQIDSIWLQRIELRSPDEVGEVLEQNGFASKVGCLTAIFVDEKCGLIGAETFNRERAVDDNSLSRFILGMASDCHASGLIVATNDLGKRSPLSDGSKGLILQLYHKGDAINVPLLDHVMLTESGWRSRFTQNDARRFRS